MTWLFPQAIELDNYVTCAKKERKTPHNYNKSKSSNLLYLIVLSLLINYYLILQFYHYCCSFVCLSYYFVVNISPFLVFPSKLLSPCIFQTCFEIFFLSGGSIRNHLFTLLDRGKVYIHSTLSIHHLWNLAEFTIVVLLHFQFF